MAQNNKHLVNDTNASTTLPSQVGIAKPVATVTTTSTSTYSYNSNTNSNTNNNSTSTKPTKPNTNNNTNNNTSYSYSYGSNGSGSSSYTYPTPTTKTITLNNLYSRTGLKENINTSYAGFSAMNNLPFTANDPIFFTAPADD
jgi:hypothetical protein